MLQPIQLRVNSENDKKTPKTTTTELSHGGGRRPDMGSYHSGLLFFKERRNERKGGKDTARLSLYPEIALHKGHLQNLGQNVSVALMKIIYAK